MSERPSGGFSTTWCVASVALYTVTEIVLGAIVGPAIVGTYVSPMLHMRVMTAMHMASFFLGGIAVGVISPGVRLVEPAVGASIAVFITMLMAVFMPVRFMSLSMDRLLAGGGIAFVLALMGAWFGEKWMGNVDTAAGPGARTRIRKQLWEGERPLLGVPSSKEKAYKRR